MAHLFQQGRPEPVGPRTRQVSPLKTRDSVERDVAVVRTESHAARFNSARALFESMAERRPASTVAVERRQSAKSAQDRSRSASLGGAASRSASAASRLDRVSRSPSPPPGEPRKLNGVGARKASVDSLLDGDPVSDVATRVAAPAGMAGAAAVRRVPDPFRRAEVLASARCPDAAAPDVTSEGASRVDAVASYVDANSVDAKSVDATRVNVNRVSERSLDSASADSKPVSVSRVDSKPVDVRPVHVKPVDSKPINSSAPVPTHNVDNDHPPADKLTPAAATSEPSTRAGLDEIPTRGPSCTDDLSTSPVRRHLHNRDLVNRQRNWMSHFTGRRGDRSSVSPEGDEHDGRRSRTPPAAGGSTAAAGTAATTGECLGPGDGKSLLELV